MFYRLFAAALLAVPLSANAQGRWDRPGGVLDQFDQHATFTASVNSDGTVDEPCHPMGNLFQPGQRPFEIAKQAKEGGYGGAAGDVQVGVTTLNRQWALLSAKWGSEIYGEGSSTCQIVVNKVQADLLNGSN